MAKVHLLGTWNAALSNLTLGTTAISLWEGSRPQNGFACAVMEFDVTLEEAATLRIRTTISNASGVQGAWGDSVETADSHVMGWWPYSALSLACGSYDVNPPGPGQHKKEIGVCEATCPEHGASGFAHQGSTADPHGKANVGCYGVNLKYLFTLTNSGPGPIDLYVYGVARNINDPASGAGGISVPTSYSSRGIFFLRHSTAQDTLRFTSDAGGANSPISVGTSGAQLDVDIAVGGSSGTRSTYFSRAWQSAKATSLRTK